MDSKKIFENGTALRTCQKKCTTKDVVKQTDETQKATQNLLQQLKEKKLTFNQFLKKVKDITAILKDNDVTKAFQKCTLEQCHDNLVSMLETYIQIYEYDCKIEKKKSQCKKHKTILALLKQKPLSPQNYKKIADTLA